MNEDSKLATPFGAAQQNARLADCFAFLGAGVSPYHAVGAARNLLEKNGYRFLPENTPWHLLPGGKYCTSRGGSSLIAWRQPAAGFEAWRGAAAHSDSPTFRIKSGTEKSTLYTKVGVEPYGGMRLSTWLDRPLGLAGMVHYLDETDTLRAKLLAPDRDLLCIPSVCVHFDREGARGAALDFKKDLQPICGAAGQSFETFLAGECGLDSPERIIGSDLSLVVRQQPCTVGLNEEFYMAPRIDDLAAAYGTLAGFLQAPPDTEHYGDVWCLFDNEEVGSGTRKGALSSFLPDVIARAEEALNLTAERSVIVRQNALFLSADNAHATHPNHPELSDAAHPVRLNGGIVIKYNASQKYTSNGGTAAAFTAVCRKAGVPVQTFYNRADLPGGSTLGNLLARSFSVPMLDIGLAQLSMHSAVETAGAADVEYLVRATAAFYAAPLPTQAELL